MHKPHKSFSTHKAPIIYLHAHLPVFSLWCFSPLINNLSLSGHKSQSQIELEICGSWHPAQPLHQRPPESAESVPGQLFMPLNLRTQAKVNFLREVSLGNH